MMSDRQTLFIAGHSNFMTGEDRFQVMYRERMFFGLFWSGWRKLYDGWVHEWYLEKARRLSDAALDNGVIYDNFNRPTPIVSIDD